MRSSSEVTEEDCVSLFISHIIREDITPRMHFPWKFSVVHSHE